MSMTTAIQPINVVYKAKLTAIHAAAPAPTKPSKSRHAAKQADFHPRKRAKQLRLVALQSTYAREPSEPDWQPRNLQSARDVVHYTRSWLRGQCVLSPRVALFSKF
ncbi:hypothetical protein AURDEDRAFT_109951 [Auricularia subglabra TFB-10046 SS5]|nr:hypothetical protein AURDEDRAFT_109951 [Auricularia subglabra TFB-10046 SS5]